MHINLVELDVALKGVNLALQWEVTVLHLITDSRCVHRWISDTLTGKARVNMRAAGKMLVRQWLGTLQSLTNEYGLTIDVKLVKSVRTMQIVSQEVDGSAQGRKRASARELCNTRKTRTR